MSLDTSWEAELAEYLHELSAAQDELLGVLNRKLALLGAADTAGLQQLAPIEQALGERLNACYQRRNEMLGRAGAQGLPADSLRSLTGSLQGKQRKQLIADVSQAEAKSRLLQHQSLTNWVVTQRALLHLSHLLEIIATGGRLRPTYGREDPAAVSGALLNRAV
jgi:hypothetical protein